MAEITWLAQPAEPDIATRLRASGQDAMTELFHAHADAIYNFCFRRTADWHTAEDLTSQVFLTAWQNRHRAREHEGTLAPWLYGIANNLCRTHHRSRRRRDDAMLRLAADVATSQPDVTQRDDDALRIRTALDRSARAVTEGAARDERPHEGPASRPLLDNSGESAPMGPYSAHRRGFA